MARKSDVVKKVMRCKLQLSDTAQPSTVLKILQKLKDLDITFDILAETGIGKTVNLLRRHQQAGELAKSLVRGWKKLVPKKSTSNEEDVGLLENVAVTDKLDGRSCPANENLVRESVNNNCSTPHGKNKNSSGEPPFKTVKRKADSENKQCEEWKRKMDRNKNHGKSQQDNQDMLHNDILSKKIEIQEEKKETSAVSKKKKFFQIDRKPEDSDTFSENKNFKSDSREKPKNISDNGRVEFESNSKSTPPKESSKESKETFSFDSSGKYSKMFKLVKDDRSAEISKMSDGKMRTRKKTDKKKHITLKYKAESKNKGHSEHKKAKIKQKDKQCNKDQEEPSMSFESYLNYDVNAFKKKERSGVKKVPPKIKIVVKEETTKDSCVKPIKSPSAFPKQKFSDSVMHLINLPLPAVLPEWESCGAEYLEKKVEKESDICDVSEESAVFTGQRLNRKMQVYSGAKTAFLPSMMSLYQQCIRTLQNNINLLHETGGVPFEILEPVLERCTPEQLLRIEECNPVYIGVTDHLWGKHCQRDFKDFKLQEYESWKEMYIRLSEEREKKLQRLTKTIVSAHSKKPKGRQVKMAFIHTVAKPPRDVRIQQEIHGTAVQQPHQLRCSVKVQDSRLKLSCTEPNRSSATSSGGSNAQDHRKKTRVAPMMAKSLKAFKKQLARR